MKAKIITIAVAVASLGLVLAPVGASAKPLHCKSGHHRNGHKCVKNHVVRGPQGPAGAAGPAGATGATGAAGPAGGGGPAGPGSAVRVTTLDGSQGWTVSANHENAGEDTHVPTLGVGGVETSFDQGGEYASLRTNVLNGKTLGDVAQANYTAGYTQLVDQHGGVPYLRFLLRDPITGVCEHHVIFSPNTQPINESLSGRTSRYEVVEGTVRYDDDAGEAPDTTWAKVVGAHASEVICETIISSGDAGAYSAGTTTSIGSITLEARGFAATTWNFSA